MLHLFHQGKPGPTLLGLLANCPTADIRHQYSHVQARLSYSIQAQHDLAKLNWVTLHALQDHLTNMKWDPHSKDSLEWDNHVPRPQGKLIMHGDQATGKRDTMQGILSGTAKPQPQHSCRHTVNSESSSMYAIMASQPADVQSCSPVVIHRKRIVRPVPGEDHKPVFQERYAWLGRPRAESVEVAASPQASVTHPVNSRPDSIWH